MDFFFTPFVGSFVNSVQVGDGYLILMPVWALWSAVVLLGFGAVSVAALANRPMPTPNWR